MKEVKSTKAGVSNMKIIPAGRAEITFYFLSVVDTLVQSLSSAACAKYFQNYFNSRRLIKCALESK